MKPIFSPLLLFSYSISFATEVNKYPLAYIIENDITPSQSMTIFNWNYFSRTHVHVIGHITKAELLVKEQSIPGKYNVTDCISIFDLGRKNRYKRTIEGKLN